MFFPTGGADDDRDYRDYRRLDRPVFCITVYNSARLTRSFLFLPFSLSLSLFLSFSFYFSLVFSPSDFDFDFICLVTEAQLAFIDSFD